MGKVFQEIDDKLADWISRQHMFFVGTAPAGLGPRRVAYLDYTGSGAETIAHLRDNGRIVLMFCAFEGPPKIVRLHGRGRAVLVGDPEFDQLRSAFDKDRTLGQRSIIVADLTRISDSCGYSLPLMDFRADRDVLDKDQSRRDEDYFPRYWREKNAESIDGLPGVPTESTATCAPGAQGRSPGAWTEGRG